MAHVIHKYLGKRENQLVVLNKTGSDPNKIYEVICRIKCGQNIEYDLWSNTIFQSEEEIFQEENDFLSCPYELEEGVLICIKCKCKKILSYSKQTRSLDEPISIFALCSKCGHKWRE